MCLKPYLLKTNVCNIDSVETRYTAISPYAIRAQIEF